MEKKKEIWIEKLIELLNEFRPTVSCANFKEHYEFIDDDIYLIREWMDGEEEQFPMYVCYKKGDFIKWLVENDKIDQTNKFCVSVNVEWKGMGYTKAFEGYESLLMILAIQDEPIRFLCEILK